MDNTAVDTEALFESVIFLNHFKNLGSIGVSWWEMVPVSDGRGKDGDGR